MLADSTRGDADAQHVPTALWQGLFFCGLALVLPWLVSAGYAGLTDVARALWTALPTEDHATPSLLWAGQKAVWMWLVQVLAGLAGCAAALLFIAWRVVRSVNLAAGLVANRPVLSSLLSVLLWALAVALLSSLWLGLCAWPSETYGVSVRSGLQALLFVHGLTRLLRAALSLWPMA